MGRLDPDGAQQSAEDEVLLHEDDLVRAVAVHVLEPWRETQARLVATRVLCSVAAPVHVVRTRAVIGPERQFAACALHLHPVVAAPCPHGPDARRVRGNEG